MPSEPDKNKPITPPIVDPVASVTAPTVGKEGQSVAVEAPVPTLTPENLLAPEAPILTDQQSVTVPLATQPVVPPPPSLEQPAVQVQPPVSSLPQVDLSHLPRTENAVLPAAWTEEIGDREEGKGKVVLKKAA